MSWVHWILQSRSDGALQLKPTVLVAEKLSGTKVTREVLEAWQGCLHKVGHAGVEIDNVDL
jgi:phosphoglycerate dehydrogenase-like enzyme